MLVVIVITITIVIIIVVKTYSLNSTQVDLLFSSNAFVAISIAQVGGR